MTTDTWIDKSTWGDGPWQHEPDRIEWRDGDYTLLMLRNRHGAWCGYVGVHPGHPWHGDDYSREHDDHYCEDDDCTAHLVADIEVHGGITFSEACMKPRGDEDRRSLVCHTRAPGEPDDVWWVGFDCLHFMDIGPALEATIRAAYAKDGSVRPEIEDPFGAPTYKTLAYATAEVESMLAQAKVA